MEKRKKYEKLQQKNMNSIIKKNHEDNINFSTDILKARKE